MLAFVAEKLTSFRVFEVFCFTFLLFKSLQLGLMILIFIVLFFISMQKALVAT